MDNNFTLKSNKCKQCGKPMHGRIDKRFCDAYCRNVFNNKVKRKEEQNINEVNKTLRKNRKILKTLSPIGKSTVRKEVLEVMGYNFNIFSSIHRTSKGRIYYLSYEFGFNPIIDNKGIEKVVIINQQKYMGSWNPWKYVKK